GRRPSAPRPLLAFGTYLVENLRDRQQMVERADGDLVYDLRRPAPALREPGVDFVFVPLGADVLVLGDLPALEPGPDAAEGAEGDSGLSQSSGETRSPRSFISRVATCTT